MINRIAERLRKLALMLSSDWDGEVLAAAPDMVRALRDSGSGSIDWHSLHDFCLQYSNLLRQRELEFVDNIAHWRGDLTEKQRAWLTSIYMRLRSAS